MVQFKWVHIENKDHLEVFYRNILPRLSLAAKTCGYALGVHGSLRRDLDLIATPWVDEHSDKDQLAREIHRAACGLERQTYQWEEKPMGRTATSFPICWADWNEPNLGHVDLSVVGTVNPKPTGQKE